MNNFASITPTAHQNEQDPLPRLLLMTSDAAQRPTLLEDPVEGCFVLALPTGTVVDEAFTREVNRLLWAAERLSS